MTRDDDRNGGITVYLPGELPELTQQTCRALLAILVELTETTALGGAEGGDQLD